MSELEETQVLSVLLWPQSFDAIAPVLDMTPEQVAEALEEFKDAA